MMSHLQFNPLGAAKGALFGIVGIGISLWGAMILKNAMVSASWPTVQGEVMESRMETKVHTKSDGPSNITYYGHVLYRYQVKNTEYSCETVAFGEMGGDNAKHAQKILKRYPKGKEVKVHYNPKEPKTAVLEPGATWSSYLPLGLGMLFIGGAVACCFYRR